MAGSDRVEEGDFARGGWTSGPGMRGERSLGSRWGETRLGVSLGAATPAAAGAGDAHLHGSTGVAIEDVRSGDAALGLRSYEISLHH